LVHRASPPVGRIQPSRRQIHRFRRGMHVTLRDRNRVVACHALNQKRLRPGFSHPGAERAPERVYNERGGQSQRPPPLHVLVVEAVGEYRRGGSPLFAGSLPLPPLRCALGAPALVAFPSCLRRIYTGSASFMMSGPWNCKVTASAVGHTQVQTFLFTVS